MYSTWEIQYQHSPDPSGMTTAIIRPIRGSRTIVGVALLALSLGGMIGPLIPALRLESAYVLKQALSAISRQLSATEKSLPQSTPITFNPLVTSDGSTITPINTEFSLVIPTVGINAPVIANVDPANPHAYKEALSAGVAHASTSFLPNQNGTVYLFSHSTNYDWFVRDLNAVFYLLKNLKEGDYIVLYYTGKQYTYILREKRIVKPSEVSYLVPQEGKKSLILQTCWPPGSITERLLLFADFVSEQ